MKDMMGALHGCCTIKLRSSNILQRLPRSKLPQLPVLHIFRKSSTEQTSEAQSRWSKLNPHVESSLLHQLYFVQVAVQAVGKRTLGLLLLNTFLAKFSFKNWLLTPLAIRNTSQ